MKVFKKIIVLLLFFAVGATSFDGIYAGGKGSHGNFRSSANRRYTHKRPSHLRQHARQAQQTVRHHQRLISPTARFERRHPPRLTDRSLSNHQKSLAIFFAIMIIGAEVVKLNMESSSVESKPDGRMSMKASQHLDDQSDWQTVASNQSLVHLKPYTVGQESDTFGPCKTLADGSKFCCDIQPHYIVECCHYLNTTNPSRCVSFDPVGIIGDQSRPNPDDIFFVGLNVRDECQSIEHTYTYDIKNGTDAFVRKLIDADLTLETYEDDGVVITNTLTPNWFTDKITLSIINNSNSFTTLSKMIYKLTKKFNLLKMPFVGIYNPHLYPFSYIAATATTVTFDNSQEEFDLLMVPITTLLNLSDNEIAQILVHEFQHLKQYEGLIRTGNNKEAEADIASVLVSYNACRVFLSTGGRGPKEIFVDRPLTRENLDEKLLTYADSIDCQQVKTELLLFDGINKNHKKAARLLLEGNK